MAIKAKKTPSSAKVTYSTTDAAVASVYDGTITANGIGTADYQRELIISESKKQENQLVESILYN